MVKKLRFQENRKPSRRNRRPPRDGWVFEPLDVVLLAIIVALVFWLQWLAGALAA
jgi:hypothetical protein